MKTREIVEAYKLLKGAKLTKMEDNDKFNVIKAMRELRPIAEKYDADFKEAQEVLKDDDFESVSKKIGEFNAAPEAEKANVMTKEELIKVNAYVQHFNESAEKAKKDLEEEEHDLKFDKLAEPAFNKLLASNDLTVEQIMVLDEVLVQEDPPIRTGGGTGTEK